ncbi:MAG: prolipoprotein diacylglyceryl transferase [Myxococcaceae bacterium]|nr:prolipoprotein diacylglyceryl transferase [Myxococcaceae bacterium]
MIPYIRPPAIPLGFTHLEPFGIMTAAGLLVGTYLIVKAARRDGIDPRPVQDFVLAALLGGVIAGHLMHIFLYHPEEIREKGWLQVLRIWDGLSSTGGMLGGALAVYLFLRWKGLRLRDYTDAIALGITPGWAIARIGCFLVHDHPGVPSHFFLAVDFPAGSLPGQIFATPRHDLGLYDAIALFVYAAILWTLRSRNILRGSYLALVMLMYGISRFFFDFLRARDLSYVDARYFGLTPAQYVAIGFVLYGATMLILRARRGAPSPADGSKHSAPA